MSSDGLKPAAFRIDYSHRVRELKTEAILFAVSAPPPNKTAVINAIWDTGATHSVITPEIAKFLRLFPIDTIPISQVPW